MAGPDGTSTDSLIERLQAEPERFDFCQAVRRLEGRFHGKPPVGFARRPADEPLRFHQFTSLRFAPRTIERYEPGLPNQPDHMFVAFLGLLGPNGPMPLHIAEYAWSREHNDKDTTFARFLDLFNHRMIAMFYRAWAASRQTVQYERAERDRFFDYLGSTLGLGMRSLCERDAVADIAKVHYSGWLSNEVRNADGLGSVLGSYFGVPTEILEFMGMWMDLPADSCCRLGESPDTGALGQTAIIGSRIWTSQQRFRIRFGPMSLPEYERFLPGDTSGERLLAWIRLYVGQEFEWDVQLVLRQEEVPRTTLGSSGRLGWTTWLTTDPYPTDADDLVLRRTALEAASRRRTRQGADHHG